MTTPMRSRMRRQTRPAKYMSRSCQAESASWSRPGSSSISFTGEFPGITNDQQPVEAPSRRRDYTAPGRNTGAYRAVGQEDTRRIPVISKYGVRFVAAMLIFVLLAGVFTGLIGMELHHQKQLHAELEGYVKTGNELQAACDQKYSDIRTESDSALLRQKALMLGLIDPAGVEVRTLHAPENADITLAEQVLPYTLASIWGQ